MNSAPFTAWLTTCGARKNPWYISSNVSSDAPASAPRPVKSFGMHIFQQDRHALRYNHLFLQVRRLDF